ncbi:MAG: DUF4397 domain-containing protein [Bacteroidetes bacterium]|nr:DUF4397 domain-containing protein [Bacteroidota bacterium]
MKNKILLNALLFLFASGTLYSQANLQIVHNSGDVDLASIDVYVDGVLAYDNLAYRSATPFFQVSSGVAIDIGIAYDNSTSVNDTIKQSTITLTANDRVAAFINGVYHLNKYAPNTNFVGIGLKVDLVTGLRNQALNANEMDIILYQGCTDVSRSDAYSRYQTQLANDFIYKDVTPYISFVPGKMVFDFAFYLTTKTPFYSALSDLSPYVGSAAIIFTSGFRNPSINENGAPLGLFMVLSNGTVTEIPIMKKANFQFIHNSPALSLPVADIYINGERILNNIGYRNASTYLDLPADFDINLGLGYGNSNSVADTFRNFPLNLPEGNYTVMLGGVINPANYAPNPDGKSTTIQLIRKNEARIASLVLGNVDVTAIHGSTDGYNLDMIGTIGNLADNLSFGDTSGYVSVAPNTYVIDVTEGANSSNIYESYIADLNPYTNNGVTVFASGFMDTLAPNQANNAFGLYMATPAGNVVKLPIYTGQVAKVQLIHNASDPAAAQVDVYVNSILAYDNFGYHTATPFTDLGAALLTNIGIAPANSTSVLDTVKNIQITFDAAKNYAVVVSGLINPGTFNPNPNGYNISLAAYRINDARELGIDPAKLDVNVFHGVTDAAGVDVLPRSFSVLVNDIKYGSFSGYNSLDTARYILDITPENNNNSILKSFEADITALGGQAVIIIASGFIDNTAPGQSEPLGLWLVFPNGTVIPLPEIAEAKIQVIHNSSDPSLDSVDIYINKTLLLVDNFPYHSATPFIALAANVEFEVGIAPKNSVDSNDIFLNRKVTLENGKSYVAMASGMVDTSNFALNPDGRTIAFDVWLHDGFREKSTQAGNFDFRTLHATTDLGAIDIAAQSITILNNDIKYSDVDNYVSLPAGQYLFDATPWNSTTAFATFIADFQAFGGMSGVLYTTGYNNPSVNQNGFPFGLWCTMPDGFTFPLQLFTGINEALSKSDIVVFPNPANEEIFISIPENIKGIINISLYDLTGKIIKSETETASNILKLDIQTLPSGIYGISVVAGNNHFSKRIIKN